MGNVTRVFAAKKVLSLYAPEFASRLQNIGPLARIHAYLRHHINGRQDPIMTVEMVDMCFMNQCILTLCSARASGYGVDQASRQFEGSYLRSKRSDSQTVQAVLEGVKHSMTSSRKSEACRSKMEEVLVVPSWRYMRPVI